MFGIYHDRRRRARHSDNLGRIPTARPFAAITIAVSGGHTNSASLRAPCFMPARSFQVFNAKTTECAHNSGVFVALILDEMQERSE